MIFRFSTGRFEALMQAPMIAQILVTFSRSRNRTTQNSNCKRHQSVTELDRLSLHDLISAHVKILCVQRRVTISKSCTLIMRIWRFAPERSGKWKCQDEQRAELHPEDWTQRRSGEITLLYFKLGRRDGGGVFVIFGFDNVGQSEGWRCFFFFKKNQRHITLDVRAEYHATSVGVHWKLHQG